MSDSTFFHNVFYTICILKSFNSHISVVICSFFEFGTVSKWCIREWIKSRAYSLQSYLIICLPNNKNFDMTKLKAFADDKLNVAKMMISLLNRKENNVGKGENAGHQQHFLFSPWCFPKPPSFGSLKIGIVW